MRLQRARPVFRALGWLSVAVIAYLSLVPHEMEVRTSLPGWIEHAIAYAGAAGLLSLGYPFWSWQLIAAALFGYSGALEALQGFVPGRHPGIEGAIVSGAGAAVGAVLTSLLQGRVEGRGKLR